MVFLRSVRHRGWANRDYAPTADELYQLAGVYASRRILKGEKPAERSRRGSN